MEIVFSRLFKKQFIKLPTKVKSQFENRLRILTDNIKHPLLNIHTLRGSKYPLQSMNITGDYRALFITAGNTVTFYEIGTHSELYE
ncbi:MAG: hypothetical protein RLZZ230_90 [Candidatus Parcubacteria bacterium]|jgi:mRNA-degrading endonuclease YafQ of YafQ-DinJ toxin-antitoxin module